jgi:hypothetical protein
MDADPARKMNVGGGCQEMSGKRTSGPVQSDHWLPERVRSCDYIAPPSEIGAVPLFAGEGAGMPAPL